MTKQIWASVELANYHDIVLRRHRRRASNRVRRRRVRALVDSRANRPTIPAALARRLGLPRRQRWDHRQVVEVQIKLCGRVAVFSALLGKGKHVRIGRIVLNELDLVIDEARGRVRRRIAKYILVEIE